jgi:hypothetical protein
VSSSATVITTGRLAGRSSGTCAMSSRRAPPPSIRYPQNAPSLRSHKRRRRRPGSDRSGDFFG